VCLNVGGKTFMTTRDTLTREKSYLSDMITSYEFGRRMSSASADDAAAPTLHCPLPPPTFFIDRDGEMFRHILNYLRDGECTLKPSVPSLASLCSEAAYYGLTRLQRGLQRRITALSN
jgi:hypothetical protein